MTKFSLPSKIIQNVPFMSLFRFASRLDWVFLTGAAISSIAFGCSIPVLTFLFGNVTDIFSARELGVISDEEFTKAVNEQVYYLLALAAGTFLLMWVGSCLWTIAGERQTQRFRQEYLKAFVEKDLGWFDVYGKSSGEIVGSIAT
jgi:ATP-binding cassette, subfamily B (MDR/TAP), member 1